MRILIFSLLLSLSAFSAAHATERYRDHTYPGTPPRYEDFCPYAVRAAYNSKSSFKAFMKKCRDEQNFGDWDWPVTPVLCSNNVDTTRRFMQGWAKMPRAAGATRCLKHPSSDLAETNGYIFIGEEISAGSMAVNTKMEMLMHPPERLADYACRDSVGALQPLKTDTVWMVRAVALYQIAEFFGHPPLEHVPHCTAAP